MEDAEPFCPVEIHREFLAGSGFRDRMLAMLLEIERVDAGETMSMDTIPVRREIFDIIDVCRSLRGEEAGAYQPALLFRRIDSVLVRYGMRCISNGPVDEQY